MAAAGAVTYFAGWDSTTDPVKLSEVSRSLFVALRPNDPSFVTVDLAGNVKTYGPSDHLLPLDAVSGVVISRSGDVIVSVGSRVFVVEGADFGRPPLELGPLEFNSTPGIANEVYAAPNLEGTAIWIVQPALRTRDSGGYDTRAYLVTSDGSSILSEVNDPRPFVPVGVTTGSRLVVNNEKDGEVLTVSESGEVTLLDHGSAIGVGRNHVALIKADGNLVSVGDFGKTVVPMPNPGGRWSTVGYSLISDVSIPNPTVTDDGRLLVDVIVKGSEKSDNGYSKVLYVVKLDGTDHHIISTPPGSIRGPAAWTDNGSSIVLIASHEVKVIEFLGDGFPKFLHEFGSGHFVVAIS